MRTCHEFFSLQAEMMRPLQVSKRLRLKMLDASCIFVLLLVVDGKLIRGQVYSPLDKKASDGAPSTDKNDSVNDVVNSIDNPMNISEESVSAPNQVNVSPLNSTAKNTTDSPVVGDIVKQVITKKCSHQYSMTCLKLDVVKLVDHLGSAESYQILPGISIVYSRARKADSNSTSEIPADLAVSLVRDVNATEKLDKFLFQKVDNFLSSLSLNVKLIDSKVLGSVRKFSMSAFSSFFPSLYSEEGTLGKDSELDKDEDEEKKGRKKKDNYHAAAMWSAGTLAAVGFSALAAMSGKALMTSMIALVLAAMSAFKHHGGHGKTSHYEIITKPAHYHDHDHLHSAATYTGAPYSYARHLVIAPADEERPPDEYKIPFRPYPMSPTYIPAHDK